MFRAIAEGANPALDQGVVLANFDWPHAPGTMGCVLTARCDFAQAKADFVKVIAVKPASEVLLGLQKIKQCVETADGQQEVSRSKWKEAVGEVKRFIQHKAVSRYYFLESEDAGLLPHLILDFQQVLSLPLTIADRADRVLQVPHPHLEHLISFYAAFSGRVGLPDVVPTHVDEVAATVLAPYRMRD